MLVFLALRKLSIEGRACCCAIHEPLDLRIKWEGDGPDGKIAAPIASTRVG